MTETVKIGSLKVEPGEKQFGFLDVAELPSMRVTMPLMIVNGTNPGHTVSITAGMHSAEFAGIEAATRTYHQTDPLTFNGKLLIVPVVNTVAFQRGTIPYINPLDNQNLYNIFPGDPYSSISYRMIHTLFTKVILRAQFYIDCHGGDLGEDLPFYCNFAYGTGNSQVDETSKLMARLYTDKFINPYQNTHGISCWEVGKKGIPSIVGEGGSMGTYKEEDIQYHLLGIKNILKHLEMLEGQAQIYDPVVLTETTNIRIDHGGVFHPFVEPGDYVKEGQKLAIIKNIFGEVVEDISAPIDGFIRIIYRNRVKSTGDIAFMMWKQP